MRIMITISLCMIVKDEEDVLARCLDSIAYLMDEIIVVDTGSTDNTKEIAARYTDKVYDFEWVDDFAAARNFSFSKATMEYIYAADADEVLEDPNCARFAQLKAALLPEIEIVQMKYVTQGEHDTVLNVQKEYRPKLFKRLRTFTWIDPIHETVRLDPVVFDSDIEIFHRPQTLHSKRDFSIFTKAFHAAGTLSSRLRSMYAKELLKTGQTEDFAQAKGIFRHIYENDTAAEGQKEAACVLARAYRLEDDQDEFFKLIINSMAFAPCAEICYELGVYFHHRREYEEAVIWYYNAAYETESLLDVHAGGDLPLRGLVDCYKAQLEQAKGESPVDPQIVSLCEERLQASERDLREWSMPTEL